jgi:hypothetical protein
MPLTGHCLCGAVTYEAGVDQPLITAYDHCDDCQRQTGSTYCMFAIAYTKDTQFPLEIYANM